MDDYTQAGCGIKICGDLGCEDDPERLVVAPFPDGPASHGEDNLSKSCNSSARFQVIVRTGVTGFHSISMLEQNLGTMLGIFSNNTR